jgi:peptidoglycan hydrolase-like protein with peptidoglycan-binding domain
VADRLADSVREAEPSVAGVRAEPVPTSLPAAAAVLHLQRLVGNAATRAVLARRELMLDATPNLVSRRYARDPDLDAAYDEDPQLGIGAHNAGVGKVQQGLADEGYAMPRSFGRNGKPDCRYGKETETAVRQFQQRYGLAETGTVGRQVLAKLDQLAGGRRPDDIRPVRGPEIDATDAAMGAYVVRGMDKANEGGSAESGIYYDYNYFARHKKFPDQYPWKDEWRDGLASEEYFEHKGFMTWRLKDGKSASAGIKAWLAGLTIAECKTTILAIEMDALRAAIGEDAFDARYGTDGESLPETTRLLVWPKVAGTPLENRIFKQSTDKAWRPGGYGHRNIKVGDRIYFFNHPKYLLKHPGGAWQGENAVYQGLNAEGKQRFSGLGAGDKTEDAMLDEMAGAYNEDRTGADYVWLLNEYAWDMPEVATPSREFLDHDVGYTKALYEKYKHRMPKEYREEGRVFPDQIKPRDILTAKPYKLRGDIRKGGFSAPDTFRLDASKVARLRPQA